MFLTEITAPIVLVELMELIDFLIRRCYVKPTGPDVQIFNYPANLIRLAYSRYQWSRPIGQN
jgi:hypothetical protein